MSNYLEYILKERNISKSELSELTGVNRTTISKLCSDKGKYKKGMRIDTAYHIAKVLNIPLDDFIEKMCDINKRDYESNKSNIKTHKKNYTNKDVIMKLDEVINLLNERNLTYEI